MAEDVESLQYELLDPDDPSSGQQQPRRDFGKERPVVILGFNEASQARATAPLATLPFSSAALVQCMRARGAPSTVPHGWLSWRCERRSLRLPARSYVQVVSNMLQSPLTGEPLPWLAFSFNPEAVRIANEKGLPVFFGDGSNATTLAAAAGTAPPRAFVLTHRSHPQLLEALDNVRTGFPSVPAFALTIDVRRAGDVQARGATAVVTRASAGAPPATSARTTTPLSAFGKGVLRAGRPPLLMATANCRHELEG